MNPRSAQSPDQSGSAKSGRHLRIRGWLWITVPGTYGLLGAAYAITPPLEGLIQPAERLVLAVQWQLVWFAFCIVPLATLLLPGQVRVIPILCVFFAFARFVYWWATSGVEPLAARPEFNSPSC